MEVRTNSATSRALPLRLSLCVFALSLSLSPSRRRSFVLPSFGLPSFSGLVGGIAAAAFSLFFVFPSRGFSFDQGAAFPSFLWEREAFVSVSVCFRFCSCGLG